MSALRIGSLTRRALHEHLRGPGLFVQMPPFVMHIRSPIAVVADGIQELQRETGRMLHTQERELVEQLQELEGLRGKNATVIRQMRLRIEQEQAEFDASGAKIQAVRSVHLRLLKDLFAMLSSTHLKAEVAVLSMGNPHAVQLVDDVDAVDGLGAQQLGVGGDGAGLHFAAAVAVAACVIAGGRQCLREVEFGAGKANPNH